MNHSFIIQKGTKMTSLVSGLNPVILDQQFEETYHVTCTLCCEYCSLLFCVCTKQANKPLPFTREGICQWFINMWQNG
jgi:hypothetical protein